MAGASLSVCTVFQQALVHHLGWVQESQCAISGRQTDTKALLAKACSHQVYKTSKKDLACKRNWCTIYHWCTTVIMLSHITYMISRELMVLAKLLKSVMILPFWSECEYTSAHVNDFSHHQPDLYIFKRTFSSGSSTEFFFLGLN